MRKPHLLSQLNSTTRPSVVVFFDTETTQRQINERTILHSLDFGYAIKCRTRRNDTLRVQSKILFNVYSDFIEFVERASRGNNTIYLVSHNLNFDIPIVHGFTELAKAGYELHNFYVKGMVSSYTWRNGKSKIIAIDNSNFYAGKLETWGDRIGLPKLEIDFDTSPRDEKIEYCKRDVEILRRLWLTWFEFLDNNDCGGFKQTVSATAFSTYRHRFMPCDIYIHGNEHALQLERDAYKGGRVECLYQGNLRDSTYYYLDVNSMYPFVMLDNLYPAGLWDIDKHPTIARLEKLLDKYAVIAKVHLNTKQNWYAFKRNKRIFYPTGSYDVTLTTPELKQALAEGSINKVYDLAFYRQEKLFTDFVKYFYTLRKRYLRKGQDGFAQITKLIMNSLYGKTGQRGIMQECIGDCPIDMVQTDHYYYVDKQAHVHETRIGGKVFISWTEGEAYNSFPAIAAHVTAYARMHLQRLRLLVPKGHVFYMDTDSLIVDEIGKQSLAEYLDNEKLGALKIELQSPYLTIYAPKDYVMKGRRKTKGIRSNAKRVDSRTFTQEKWAKFRGMVANGELDDYKVTTIEKHLNREIYSGVVSAVGWVEPFDLLE